MPTIRKYVATGVSAAIVGTGACVLLKTHESTAGSLHLLEGSTVQACSYATSPIMWTAHIKFGMPFALDGILLSSRSARITVTAVQPIDPTGGIEVTQVGFVLNGPIYEQANKNHGLTTMPSLLPYLQQGLPAHLHFIGRRPSGFPATEPFNGAQWQVGVIATAPPYSTGASATGVRLTYRSGSKTRTLDLKDSFALSSTATGCPKKI